MKEAFKLAKIIYGIEEGVFIVDDEDYEWLNQYEWRDHPDGYAQARVEGRLISMHRLIMKDPEGVWIDHKNRLVNDNRRCNLRYTNNSLNQANKRKSHNKSTEYKGVVKRGETSFECTIQKDGVYYYLGTFTDKLAAASCYNYHAKTLFGEHARLNPVEKENWEEFKSEQKRHSDYKGVHKERNVWRVRTSHKGEEIVLGYYTNEIAAANVYNHNIKRIKGNKAVLNNVELMSPTECEEYTVQVDKTSQYKGVSKRGDNQWIARIYHNHRERHLGTFATEEEAAKAYNNYIIENKLKRDLNIIKTNS